MKRAEKTELHCRRQEFVCRLYDVIKDLNRSLKSDCNQGANKFMSENGSPFGSHQKKIELDEKNKGSECCCPPGCCEISLVFKPSSIPNYPGTKKTQSQKSHQGYGGAPFQGEDSAHAGGYGNGPSQYHWHKEYHCNGCWSHGEASGQGGGVPSGKISSQPQTPAFQQFHLPSSPEEAIAMGCFVARTA